MIPISASILKILQWPLMCVKRYPTVCENVRCFSEINLPTVIFIICHSLCSSTSLITITLLQLHCICQDLPNMTCFLYTSLNMVSFCSPPNSVYYSHSDLHSISRPYEDLPLSAWGLLCFLFETIFAPFFTNSKPQLKCHIFRDLFLYHSI